MKVDLDAIDALRTTSQAAFDNWEMWRAAGLAYPDLAAELRAARKAVEAYRECAIVDDEMEAALAEYDAATQPQQ